MNKKVVIILVAAVVALALIITGTVIGLKGLFKNSSSSDASQPISEKAKITVGSVSAKKGETIEIPVKIDKNPGIMAMLFDIKYDSSVLQYMNYSKGDVLSDYSFNDLGGSVRFVNIEDNDITKNGTLFTLKFKVLADAPTGESLIEPMIDEYSLTDFDESIIKSDVTNGTVTVNE